MKKTLARWAFAFMWRFLLGPQGRIVVLAQYREFAETAAARGDHALARAARDLLDEYEQKI